MRRCFSCRRIYHVRYLATGISHSGSSLRDTRMVSPIPSASKAPIPTALFIRPSSPSPASVTPRWSGYCIPSLSISATRRRTERTITTVLDDLMEMTMSWKSYLRKMRRNSIQLSTMPSGVSPYRLRIRSERLPWLTPIRTAVWFSLQMLMKGTSLSSIFCSSWAYSSSVYSSFLNVRAGST